MPSEATPAERRAAKKYQDAQQAAERDKEKAEKDREKAEAAAAVQADEEARSALTGVAGMLYMDVQRATGAHPKACMRALQETLGDLRSAITCTAVLRVRLREAVPR